MVDRLPAEVARLVISSTSVELADGAVRLLGDMPAQTWRYSQ